MVQFRRWFVITALLLLGTAPALAQSPVKTAKATFAGGCFWCMEPPYDKLQA